MTSVNVPSGIIGPPVCTNAIGAACIRSLYIPKPDGSIEHKREFYIAPSTEGERKGAEFGRKYFGVIGEKIFGTLGYVFGPADEENNKNK